MDPAAQRWPIPIWAKRCELRSESDKQAQRGLGSAEPSDIAYFTRPMHPDVKQEEGTCPICNMDLSLFLPKNWKVEPSLLIACVARNHFIRARCLWSSDPNLSEVNGSARCTVRPLTSLRFDGWIEESNAPDRTKG